MKIIKIIKGKYGPIIEIFKKELSRMFHDYFKGTKEERLKQSANWWTFKRFIIAITVPIFTLMNTTVSLAIALIGTAYGAISDYKDGNCARKYGNSSNENEKNNKKIQKVLGTDNVGATLDIVADKSFSGTEGTALTILNPIFLISLLGEVAIAATNIAYKTKHKDINISSTIVGKFKEWPLKTEFVLGLISLFFTSLAKTPTITNETIIAIKEILSTATQIGIFVTGGAQIATIISYIRQNNKNIATSNSQLTYSSPRETSLENTPVQTQTQTMTNDKTGTQNYQHKVKPEKEKPKYPQPQRIQPRGQICSKQGGRATRARTRNRH